MAVEVTVLGSGTLRPDADHHSAAHLVRSGDLYMLMDCGSGTLHGLARWGSPWERLSHMLITHFHADHVGDLAPLLFALSHGLEPRRDAPLALLGPPGVRAFMQALAGAHGPWVLEPGFPLEITELERADSWSDSTGEVTIKTHPTHHTDASMAYRVELAGATVAYTGDTGPAPGLGAFLSGSALLIAECSHPDPALVETHLTPTGLAALAGEAAPGLVVVTHVYPDLERDAIPDLVSAAGYEGTVRVASDGLSVEVADGEARCR